ncbi:MAG: PIN domain-containing protein [Halobacteriales archaeon]|nr:PIN domain-containing protein [Halobacteriales archaeon]
MADTDDRFAPISGKEGPTPLFLDTSGLFPYFDPDTEEHDEVNEFLRGRIVELGYRPLYTNRYVVDELVTLLLYKTGRETAVKAYDAVMESETVRLLDVSDEVFERAGESLREHEGSDASFTDHTVAVQAKDENVSHVLAYDGDFERLGMNVVPRG